MPRSSKEQTAAHRAAIETQASRLVRERGFAVSVADVMSAAGLTHGGFYGHFGSKDEMLSKACALAFDGAIERWRQRGARPRDDRSALAAVVDGYLSPANRNETSAPCPIVSLAADVSRSPARAVRDEYVEGLDRMIDFMESLQRVPEPSAAREAAIGQFCTMVGAMLLARASKGTELSDELLQVGRKRALGSSSRRRS